jgi:hypothetical protein
MSTLNNHVSGQKKKRTLIYAPPTTAGTPQSANRRPSLRRLQPYSKTEYFVVDIIMRQLMNTQKMQKKHSHKISKCKSKFLQS